MAAKILTQYYHIVTFEHIVLWHHAAGDFILQRKKNRIDVRLIAARQYVPVFKNQKPDEAVILHALLIFLLNLTIRIRLDRLDGTGEIVWTDDVAVEGSVNGFYQGLEKNISIPGPTESFIKIFKKYVSNLSRNELVGLLNDIVDTYHSRSPDIPVIRKHLVRHASVLYQTLAGHINP